MDERRHGQQRSAGKSAGPGERGRDVALALDVAHAGSELLGRVGNLVIVAARRDHRPQLVVGRGVVNQRAESAQAPHAVVVDQRPRGLQAVIGAIAVQAREPRQPLAMVANAQLVVGLVKRAVGRGHVDLAVALEASARNDVEHAVGAVAVFSRVAAALDLQIVNVLGVDLRPDVARDIRVGHGHAVDFPRDLVPAADVQLIVRHVGAGHEIGDHGHAVAEVRAGGVGNVLPAHQRQRGLRCLDGGALIFVHLDRLALVRQPQLQVQIPGAARSDGHRLDHIGESRMRGADAVFAHRNRLELELAHRAARDYARIAGIDRAQRHLHSGDGAVTGVVNDTLNRTEHRRPRVWNQEETRAQANEYESALE